MKIPFKFRLVLFYSLLVLSQGCSSQASHGLQAQRHPAETAEDDREKHAFIDFSFSPSKDKLAVAVTGKEREYAGVLIVNLADGRILEKFENYCASKPVWSTDGEQLFFMAYKKDLKEQCGEELSPEAFSKLVRENTLVYKYDSDTFTPVVQGLIVLDIMYSKFLQSPVFTAMEEFFESGADWNDWRAKRRPDLWTINLTDQQPHPLTSEHSIESSPIMSDDGILVFYNLYLPYKQVNAQFMLNLRTMEKKPLDLAPFFVAFRALSQDNRYLLFIKNPITKGEVQSKDLWYLYDLETQEHIEVMGEDVDISDGDFLGEGKSLVISAKDSGDEEFSIWIMRDGINSPTRIKATGVNPHWNGVFERYDERNITFTDNQSIYVMNIDTGENRIVYSLSSN